MITFRDDFEEYGREAFTWRKQMKDASQCDIPNCRTSSPGRTHAFYGTGCASRYLSNHPCNSYCTAKDARDIKNKVTSDTSIAICLLINNSFLYCSLFQYSWISLCLHGQLFWYRWPSFSCLERLVYLKLNSWKCFRWSHFTHNLWFVMLVWLMTDTTSSNLYPLWSDCWSNCGTFCPTSFVAIFPLCLSN